MEKQLLYQAVENKSQLLTGLSDAIWEYAELSMQEHRSAAAYIEILKAEGFTVEETLCGMPTAFLGKFGTGKPVIGILGEYIGRIFEEIKHRPLYLVSRHIKKED